VTNTAERPRPDRGARGPPPPTKSRRPGLAELESFAMNGAAGENGGDAHLPASDVANGNGGHRGNPLVKRARLGSVAENAFGAESDSGGGDNLDAAGAAAAAAAAAMPRMPVDTGLEDLADKYTLGRTLGKGTYG
jgi:hypothetical protein